MMDTKLLRPGQKYADLVDTYVIFITENDIMGDGFPLYHVDRCIAEKKKLFGDGSHIIYVNGAYDDETNDIGKLMHDFRCKEASEMHFKVLSDKVRYFKETEGGTDNMGNVFDDIRERSKAEGEAIGEARGEVIGEARGKHLSSITLAEKLISRGRETYEEIAELTGLPIEEVSNLDH